MDDFPAVPASPGARWPTLAVVVPVRDGGRDFERCLRALRASDYPEEVELIVVDDGSIDGSAELAGTLGARVLRHERPLGPAAARNAGALAATAPLLFFVDADVAVHGKTLRRAVDHMDADPGLAALFGSYDDNPAAPGTVSKFRNLLHHYVHQNGAFVGHLRPAHTFWTGCGLIRRRVFLDSGGFDPHLYRRPAIEDIELGYRLSRSGWRIALAGDVQATHLKRWTFAGMVRTDILCRGVPWMLLIWRSGVREGDLNVGIGQRLSVVATGLMLVSAAIGAFFGPALWVAAGALGTIVGLNARFYRFLARRRGVVFASACVGLHIVYFFCCGASVAIAALIRFGPRARVVPATVAGRADAAEDASAPAPRPSRRAAKRRMP